MDEMRTETLALLQSIIEVLKKSETFEEAIRAIEAIAEEAKK